MVFIMRYLQIKVSWFHSAMVSHRVTGQIGSRVVIERQANEGFQYNWFWFVNSFFISCGIDGFVSPERFSQSPTAWFTISKAISARTYDLELRNRFLKPLWSPDFFGGPFSKLPNWKIFQWSVAVEIYIFCFFRVHSSGIGGFIFCHVSWMNQLIRGNHFRFVFSSVQV